MQTGGKTFQDAVEFERERKETFSLFQGRWSDANVLKLPHEQVFRSFRLDSGQIALRKRWVETWRLAGQDLERIRRKEIRELDTYKTILLLCGPADYTRPPYAPKSWSGLVEQQRWFKKAVGRE